MEHSAGHAVTGSASDGARADGEPAVRDAAEILARIAADDAAADAARERYRMGPLPSVDADPRAAALMAPGERVVAVHQSAVLERREPRAELDAPGGLAGQLYVTTRRLLLLGRIRLSIDLGDIEEAVLSGERLLLVLRDGQGVSVETTRPRLLRVELAAARAALRT